MTIHGMWYATDNPEEIYYIGPCKTRGEVIAKAKLELDLEDGQEFYIGQGQAHVPTIDSHVILESLKERAIEHCGDAADGWLDDLKADQIVRLESFLTATLHCWLNEQHLMPLFGEVTNTETIKAIKKGNLNVSK